MRSLYTIVFFAALVTTTPLECVIISTITISQKAPPSPSHGNVDPAITRATTSAVSYDLTDYLTISVLNTYGSDLSVSFGSDLGGPSPINNPSATLLSHGSSTHYLFPTGWAGRINIGPNLDPDGSKIEASFTGPPDVDISFVDGFSVPITCSARGNPLCGCNIDLFRQRNVSCQHQREGPVCLNPAQNFPNGPAAPFFAACAGAAYTYPEDDTANVGGLDSLTVSCCVGVSCPIPPNQRSGLPHIPSRGLPSLG